VVVGFGVGIGTALAPNDGNQPDELLKRADRALYRAKANGRSSVCFFEPDMDLVIERRIQVEQELRSALVSLDGNQIIGFEALARWESKSLGHIAPDMFIPIAEEAGLISSLSTELFCRACRDATAWPENFDLECNL